MASSADNPIAQRIDYLNDQWTMFAKKRDARILLWEIDVDEVDMVNAWMGREALPEAAATPDVFLDFDTPFAVPTQHGLALREALRLAYDGDRPALVESGIDAAWQCPPFRHGTGDVEAWLEALESLHAAYQGQLEKLVVRLQPSQVSDLHAYTLWLQRLAQSAPSHLRFIVMETTGANQFAELASVEPKRVVTQVADLDMPSALEEVSADAGNLDTPGGQFRHIYVQMNGAVKRRDLAVMEPLAVAALAITEQQGWPQLSAVVHFFMGGFFLQLGRNVDAFHRFMAADASGEQSVQGGEAAGVKTRLHARLAAGTALFQEKAYLQAARHYQETVPLAQLAEEKRSELDCWRLASCCHGLAGDPRTAWAKGMEGIRVAGTTDEETRKTSTLAYLGDAMMRLAQDPQIGDARTIDNQMTTWLGPKWRP